MLLFLFRAKKMIFAFDRRMRTPVTRKKAIAAQSRRARVYKHTGGYRVPFAERRSSGTSALAFEKRSEQAI